ncbi:sigma-54 interaction domain-containing protein [Acetohalobium arabaticum]|uniref:PAS modulated sigma54 specific transcriptional regulator, Fis family n=1 Tax=Acetohalobium arabaticum (strain ATCC 49924 / DSM 5501 / Z-7288) TaxID=574087 RepID=D9QPL2_ACEAZ|nr:sigma-54-dependent Fis family transcriptional regulator [Acetohalobium arabaticum]ADL12453.1 PAS modulated sigma54 specific transcriptional regulator, Fis family [Acetohalobium arabaticum DSM 5501]
MTKLREIGSFLQRVADAFAAVLDYEISIADHELTSLTGTGEFDKEMKSLCGQGMSRYLLSDSAATTSLFVEDTSSSEFCKHCQSKEVCPTKAAIVSCIRCSEQKMGAFSLIAVDEKQQQTMIENKSELMSFSQNVANFIASTLGEKQMRDQMKVMADRFRAVINSVHEGIIAINAKGIITHINRSAKQLLGIGQEKLGEDIDNLFSKIELDKILQEMLEQNYNYFEEEIEYKKENKSFPLLCNITLINNNDQIAGATISFRKLDEMKKLANRIMAEDERITLDSIKGTSNQIVNIKKKVKKVASTDSTILIRGASGTGKGMFAQAIHKESNRCDNSFVTVNCAAIPENLLESELFGYEEGAFTGAKKGGKPGKFELADEGTIFLDEIGDMPIQFQVKLLKAIENKRIMRVGGVEPIDINVRIIAATNQDLDKMVTKGTFREDLFYRLNVIPINIPPLRERQEDISLLLHFFLEKYAELLNKEIKDFTAKAKKKLLNYSWPGNIRELENTIEYAVNLETSHQITIQSLPNRILKYQLQVEEKDRVLPINEVEKKTIIKALKKFETKQRAAEVLGISETTLYRRIKKYNIDSNRLD